MRVLTIVSFGSEYTMTTAMNWDLSNVLSVTLKSSEKCPAYLQFTSKKGQQYGRVPRNVCMFPETWAALRELQPRLMEDLTGDSQRANPRKLYPNWEVEVRDFKGLEYVCFSQWNAGAKMPKFNMTGVEYRALLKVSDEIEAGVKGIKQDD